MPNRRRIDRGERIARIINRPPSHIIEHLKTTTPEDAQDVRDALRAKNMENFSSVATFSIPFWGVYTAGGETAVTLRWLGRTWEWKVR